MDRDEARRVLMRQADALARRGYDDAPIVRDAIEALYPERDTPYARWVAGEALYEEVIAAVWGGLLARACWDEGAPNFAWHMAEVGCSPEGARVAAARWRDGEFDPVGFDGDIERFADELQQISGSRHEVFR
jgi:hypothetical protein